jgi:hypothetical protein
MSAVELVRHHLTRALAILRRLDAVLIPAGTCESRSLGKYWP